MGSFVKTVATAMLAVVTLSTAAVAHSFNVTMVVPAGGVEQATQGFLVASGERDSHAGQESDGHLGGLDVYFSVFEVENFDTLRARVLASDPDIIALVGAELADNGVQAAFDGADAWLLPVYAVSAPARREFLPDDPTGDVAQLSYVAARLIDLAVRAQGGADDSDALRAVVAGF